MGTNFFGVVRLEVLKAVLLKNHFFWNVTLCHWVSGSQSLEGTIML
jgi:hypothetical protein